MFLWGIERINSVKLIYLDIKRILETISNQKWCQASKQIYTAVETLEKDVKYVNYKLTIKTPKLTIKIPERRRRRSCVFFVSLEHIMNTRRRCEICSKLTIKTPERRY